MRFSRTRLSNVLHIKVCALSRSKLIKATEDASLARSTIDRGTIEGLLLDLKRIDSPSYKNKGVYGIYLF